MVENNLKYTNLRYIGTSGFKVTKEAVKLGHEIGAQLIIDAYSVQECMPLGCIASGTISSLDKSWQPTEGLMVMGNLCHVRVMDKNGENVDEGEEGEIRITSPILNPSNSSSKITFSFKSATSYILLSSSMVSR